MCTITFIPKTNNDFILTSNRDEAPGRETFPPEIYEEDAVELLYPKDAVAGGTWIGASNKKRIVCLMNGGFVSHKRKAFYRQLLQLVWDGETYHFSEEPLAPQIWSSSPLYPENLKKKREQWFSAFLLETIKPSEEALLQFHKTAGEGDLNSNLIMDRGFIKTKSITQISKKEDVIEMRYEDLQTGIISNSDMGF